MKLNGNAIKPGNVIEHNSRLWTAVKVAHVKPGKGGAFAQIELRDIRDGTKLNERFRSSETVERVMPGNRQLLLVTRGPERWPRRVGSDRPGPPDAPPAAPGAREQSCH